MSKGTKTVVAKPAAKKAAAKPAAKAATKAAKPAEKKPAVKAEEKVVAKKAPAKAAAKPAAKAATKVAKPAAEKKTVAKAAPKAPAKAAKAPAKKSAAPKKVTQEVVADCPLATTVSIAGTFNNWMVDVDMLKKDKKTGLWKIKLELVPGDYEYKFVCDGENWDVGDNKIMHV